MTLDWCILRTSGRSTLRLAQSLCEDGFEAWTPTEVRRIRIPRANIRRDVTLPLMPSYVFARAGHLVDLLQMAAMPFKPRRSARSPAHCDFSVMHYHDSIPLIADTQLNALRQIEAKRTPRPKAQRTFAAGVQVRVMVEGGSFAGMKGTVQRSGEGYSVVWVSDRLMVKIPTSMLEENNLQVERSVAGTAARKAA